MRHVNQKTLFIAMEATQNELVEAFSHLSHTALPFARSNSEQSSSSIHMKNEDGMNVSDWHDGAFRKYIVAGDVFALTRVADMTSEERETAILTARKYHPQRVFGVATASLPEHGNKNILISELRPLRFLGIVVAAQTDTLLRS